MSTTAHRTRSRRDRASSSSARATRCIPLDGIEEQVLEHVPVDVTLTVTASPAKGLEPTFDLVERFVAHGYTVVPHLSARLVATASTSPSSSRDAAELGLRDVFVVAGDAAGAGRPVRGRRGAARRSGHELGHPFERDRDHRLPGEPPVHRRRDDDRRDVREGERTRPTSRARSASIPAVTAPVDRGRLGARHAAAGLRRHSRRRLAGEAAARLDPDRDRRLAALPAQERVVRVALPARRLQPGPADRRARCRCSHDPEPQGRRLPRLHVQRRRGHRALEAWAAGCGRPRMSWRPRSGRGSHGVRPPACGRTPDPAGVWGRAASPDPVRIERPGALRERRSTS